jgi:hypothetical protein
VTCPASQGSREGFRTSSGSPAAGLAAKLHGELAVVYAMVHVDSIQVDGRLLPPTSVFFDRTSLTLESSVAKLSTMPGPTGLLLSLPHRDSLPTIRLLF